MQIVETGRHVIVARLLDEAASKLADGGQHWKNRRIEATGTLCAWFGPDRSYVWVNHGGGKIAAYLPSELEGIH